MESNLRQALTRIFCDCDDFCQLFEQLWAEHPQLTAICGEKISRSRLTISDIMTIVIAFHLSGYRTFQDFYIKMVLPSWGSAFPNLVSYTLICRIDALVAHATLLFYPHSSRGNNGYKFY